MEIFISYSSKNRSAVEALAADLEALGHGVWYDRELTGGHKWWADILHSIRACDLFVFALTPEVLDSQACKLEFAYASALNKRIVPILLADVKLTLLPSALQMLQVVDYRRRDKQQAFALSKALTTLPEPQSLPDVLPPEPMAPLSPLAGIQDRLEKTVLTLDEQKALIFDLRELLAEPDTAADARELLKRFRSRPDLLVKIEKEIAALLTDREPPVTKSRIRSLIQERVKLEPRVFSGHSGAVLAVDCDPNGNYVLTGSEDQSAWLWDLRTGQPIRPFKGHVGAVSTVAFSPDGKYIATGGADGTVRLWDTETGEQLQQMTGNAIQVYSVAFSPDGEYLLTGQADRTARLWHVVEGHELLKFMGHEFSVYGVAFAPDGQSVLTGSLDQTARLWNAETGDELCQYRGHSRGVTGVAFSPDGDVIATASDDGTARLWDRQSGRELEKLDGQERALRCVAYSPYGNYVVAGSEDHTASLWNAATGDLVRQYTGHTGAIGDVAFSPTGLYVLTGSKDKTARLHHAGVVA
jgi:hypothetical protein